MLPAEFRKFIVDTVVKQLEAEGYELTGREMPVPQLSVNKFSPVSGANGSITVHVLVVSEEPLAVIVSITKRLENGEIEFDDPITVRPSDAETRVRAAIAVAVSKSGEVGLSRVLSLVPVQSTLLEYLDVKEVASLLAVSRSVRAALSTKNVDVSYWKVKLRKDFPDETVADASSPTAYRLAYFTNANIAYENKKSRKRDNAGRLRASPEPERNRPYPPFPDHNNPFAPRNPYRPNPNHPWGQPDPLNPFGGGPNFPPFGRF